MDFAITPATPTVAVTDAGGTYDGLAFGADATVGGIGGGSGPSLEGVGLTVSYYAGTTAVGMPMAGVPTAAGTYTVLASFPGSADYGSNMASVTFRIAPATPTVAVSDPGGTYDGTPSVASATVTGLSGPAGATLEGVTPSLSYYVGTYSGVGQLTGLTSLSGAPSGVGTYTVLAGFPGSADYAAASALANFRITPATPTVAVVDAGGTYRGTAFVASATVAGVSGPAGATLEGVTPSLTYYAGTYSGVAQLTGLTALAGAPSGVGAYTVLASFPGSSDYVAATGLANFSIGRATPTVGVNAPGGAYSGTAFVASAAVAGGASLEGVAPSLTYYAGTYTSLGQLTGMTAMSGAPIQPGVYTVVAEFAGSADYTAAAGLANFHITPATPTVAVVDAGGTYSGTAFGASATVTGLSGLAVSTLEGVAPSLTYYVGAYSTPAQLTGLTALPTAPAAAGSYTVLASFPGSSDYAAAAALASFHIDPGDSDGHLECSGRDHLRYGAEYESTRCHRQRAGTLRLHPGRRCGPRGRRADALGDLHPERRHR